MAKERITPYFNCDGTSGWRKKLQKSEFPNSATFCIHLQQFLFPILKKHLGVLLVVWEDNLWKFIWLPKTSNKITNQTSKHTSQSRTVSLSFARQSALEQRLDVSFNPIVPTSKSLKYLDIEIHEEILFLILFC